MGSRDWETGEKIGRCWECGGHGCVICEPTPEPVHEYTVRVSQERSKLIVVRASSPHEANAAALEQTHAEYGGWTWDPPKAGFVHVNFDVGEDALDTDSSDAVQSWT